MTRLTRRAAERTSAVGAAPTPRTVRLLSAGWGATPDTSGCGSNPIPRPKPCVDTSMAAPGLVASSIPMNRTAIHRSFVRTPPCVTAARNGRAMMTATVFAKFRPTSRRLVVRLAHRLAAFPWRSYGLSWRLRRHRRLWRQSETCRRRFHCCTCYSALCYEMSQRPNETKSPTSWAKFRQHTSNKAIFSSFRKDMQQ